MRNILLGIFTFILVLLLACQKNPNEPENELGNLESPKALVCVIENNNSVGGQSIETAFQIFKNSILPVFSDFFTVPKDSMKNMTLNQIIDVYGEAWQIKEIQNISSEYYDKFISLTDEMAMYSVLIDSLSLLSEQGYSIDMIFNLHGGSNGVSFYSNFCLIDKFIQDLNDRDIQIRSLYQTCCNGSGMVDDWQEYGIQAVNGAVSINSFALFSPVFYIQEWITGIPFSEAVENAYNMEIQELSSYRDRLPVDQFFLTDENKQDSKQIVGGVQPNLKWHEF